MPLIAEARPFAEERLFAGAQLYAVAVSITAAAPAIPTIKIAAAVPTIREEEFIVAARLSEAALRSHAVALLSAAEVGERMSPTVVADAVGDGACRKGPYYLHFWVMPVDAG